ncbi:NlpC/P60 family protein [Cellulomonas humilata]|uniref:Cell wall-associated NlpC family hydrolase n=1 Tax=Cellulomonas humilata TaxID=144055 RepID=A0ABU0EEQ1_9CELL|nr:NlpC/P60 family protein [Cellulomonas humilata]MDQ0373756.1 cell wall-associated NlpC family hydrolase [Cellulomonas humilata]
MSVLEAREIYRFARLAGFEPDEAATMTAIALAESGGETGAHNAVGEDSRGLWQINVSAHPSLQGVDLSDPLANAKAAFDVSGGGADISPWTVTHGGAGARYLSYRTEAEVAAQLNGDPVGGSWAGTDGYGDVTAAGGDGGGADVGEWHQSGALQQFLDAATAQAGDTYVFGAAVDVDDADPDTFDCSGLVSWSAGRVGVDLPHASWRQYLELKELGLVVPVEEAIDTPGALLFNFPWEPQPGESSRPGNAHVAISMGDGRTIEAMNPTKGVLFGEASERRFQFAAVIPGISDGTGVDVPVDPGLDTDGDGITDVLEAKLGLDLFLVDSDGDGISDGYELLVTGTGAATSDSDGDLIGDSAELGLGTNPLAADSDGDGTLDGALPGGLDSDGDTLDDGLEQVLRSDPFGLDSDADGFTDKAEYGAGYDLADPLSNPLVPSADDIVGT